MQEHQLKYKVGIVGAGTIVANLHLPVLLSMPNVEVVYVADVNANRAAEIGAAFKVPTVGITADLAGSKEPLARLLSADIVLIAVPYGTREPLYDLLRAKKPALYVEKPFARTVQQHKKYCSNFAPSQISLGFQRRALGSVALLKELLRCHVFGPLLKVRVEHGRPGQLTGSNYSGDFDLAGGGILFEVGIHWIDLALFITAATSVRLHGGRMVRQESFDLHTEATFALQAENQDFPLEILVSGLRETRNTIEFQFEHATLFLSQADGRLWLHAAGQKSPAEISSESSKRYSTPFQLCHAVWTGLIESIIAGVPNWSSASSSLLTTEVIEHLYGMES